MGCSGSLELNLTLWSLISREYQSPITPGTDQTQSEARALWHCCLMFTEPCGTLLVLQMHCPIPPGHMMSQGETTFPSLPCSVEWPSKSGSIGHEKSE